MAQHCDVLLYIITELIKQIQLNFPEQNMYSNYLLSFTLSVQFICCNTEH